MTDAIAKEVAERIYADFARAVVDCTPFARAQYNTDREMFFMGLVDMVMEMCKRHDVDFEVALERAREWRKGGEADAPGDRDSH